MPLPSDGRINRFECIKGKPGRLRIAIPETDAVASFVVDQTTIWVDLDTEAGETLEKLRVIVDTSSIVTAGVFRTLDGSFILAWLLSRNGSLIPSSRQQLLGKNKKTLFKCLPWLITESALLALSIHNLMHSFAWVILLLICALGAMVTLGMVFYSTTVIYSTYRNRSLMQQSEAALQDARSRPQPTGAVRRRSIDKDNAPDERVSVIPPIDDAQAPPELQRIMGAATDIKVENTSTGANTRIISSGNGLTVVPSSKMDFRRYTFKIHDRTYQIFSGRNLGDRRLFIAEGDVIEVVALSRSDWPQSDEQLVYALRNLEDRTIYASHLIMRASKIPFPMVGVTRNGFSRIRKMFVLVAFLTTLFFASVPLWSDHHSLDMAATSAISLVAIWVAGFEMPMFLWNLKWRRGYPSRRQALTQRVYALLGIASPQQPGLKPVEI